MKLPLTTSIKIFWEESLSYVIAYGVYAIIVCSIILFVEFRIQQSSLLLNKLIFPNAIIAVVATILIILSLFIIGWMPRLLGGEVIAVLVMVVISMAVIFALKMFFINSLGLQFESPKLCSMLSSLFLFTPYILFYGFIFALGSGFKN